MHRPAQEHGLSKIPAVQIPDSGSYKFIVVLDRRDGRICLFSDPNRDTHVTQFMAFTIFAERLGLDPEISSVYIGIKISLFSKRFEVLGGGDIEITDGRIAVSGDCGSYGRFDPKTVQTILSEHTDQHIKGRTVVID